MSTYFGDTLSSLNENTPVGASDPVSDVDDAIRQIKRFLLNSGAGGLLGIIHPVGSLYFSVSDTNPATTLGFGTWAAYAAGRVLVGVGEGTDENAEAVDFAAEDTGGEYNHTLTEAELASHIHTLDVARSGAWDGLGMVDGEDIPQTSWFTPRKNDTNDAINASGSDSPHNNVQPYVAVYIWRRTT